MSDWGSTPWDGVEKRKKKRAARSAGSDGDDGDDRRPLIRLRPSHIDEAVEALDKAFGSANAGPVFQRGGQLVHIVQPKVRRDDDKTEELEHIETIGLAALRAEACKVARFEKYDVRSDDFRPIDPPKPIVEAFNQAPRWRGIRDLVQLVGAPLLRRNGSLLSAAGYDSATGLYLTHPLPVRVPDRPTDEEVQRANEELTGLFSSFAYSDPEGLSGLGLAVSLAALIAAILRPTLRSAPAIAISAPAPGTGKSYLANVIAAAATGERAVAVATGTKPEEFEKALAAALLAGRPLISLDNMTLPLGGQLLNMILTEREVAVRILGLSKGVTLPAAPTILATGNNLRIAGDVGRRTLMIRLDAKVERPEQRSFDGDPLGETLTRRAQIVSAALTIVRWHLNRRDPALPFEKSFAGFDDWSARVRAALVALGHRDPVDALDVARGTDEGMEQLRTLIYLWREVLGDQAVTANDAIARAFLIDLPSGKRTYPEFAAAIAAVAGDAEGKPRDGKRLGKYLARVEGRIVAGYRFGRTGQFNRAVTWQLQAASI